MNNNRLIYGILDSIDMTKESALKALDLWSKYKYEVFYKLLNTMDELVIVIKESVNILSIQDSFFYKINESIVENICYSISNIRDLSYSRSHETNNKIEFELLNLLRLLYLVIYYFSLVEGNEEKEFNFFSNKDKDNIVYSNIMEYKKNDNYKYDVSVIILGYDKLEYTKMCVEAFLKNVDPSINYELILFNHGSKDGTKQYFNSVGCTKQIDLKYNGLGINIIPLLIEGRYYCMISNDVIVGKNVLSNMLSCIKSDETIKYVVPLTTNVSNFQTVEYKFTTTQDFYKVAEKNNVKNKFRWEERTRLINPIMLLDMESYIDLEIFWEYFRNIKTRGFNDDMMSLVFRRNGKKNILAKDSFCYHFGSVTLENDNSYLSASNFNNRRKVFKKRFGIDPWGIGFCYDYNLFQYLDCNDKDSINILGINCGMGSNPLKVRETIKEKTHNLNAKIYNITDDKSFLEDLKGVSDYVSEVKTELDIEKSYNDIKFDYIIFESNMENYKMDKLIYILKKKLTRNGVLCILNTKIENAHRVESALYEGAWWYIIKK